jgi:hypothetical protein
MIMVRLDTSISPKFVDERMAADAPLAIRARGVDRRNVAAPTLLRRELPGNRPSHHAIARARDAPVGTRTSVAQGPQQRQLIPLNRKADQLFRFAFRQSPR